MESVAIRNAAREDRDSIEQIYRLSAGTRFSLEEDEWVKWVQSKGLMVAELNDQVVGFGGIDVEAKEQLKWLYLTPDFQGRGIGSRLLHELEEVGWRCGLKSIRLHSTPNSESFYTKFGYIRVTIGAQFGHDHDGIEMIKARRDNRA